MKKNLIVAGVTFVVGFVGVLALKQVGITPIGEDGEINWLLMIPLGVAFAVGGHYLGKIIK
jgi:hypothetical protein